MLTSKSVFKSPWGISISAFRNTEIKNGVQGIKTQTYLEVRTIVLILIYRMQLIASLAAEEVTNEFVN